jgi:AraC-like DNA-binding protein
MHEYARYEDAYSLAMDDTYPIKYIIYGMTNPFQTYKNKRPPTKMYYVFEYVLNGRGYIHINGEWQTLEAGCLFIIGKDDARNFYSDPNEPMHKLWVSFASEYIDLMMLKWNVGSGIYKVDLKGCFEEIYNLHSSPLSQEEKLAVIAENIHKIILAASAVKKTNAKNIIGLIENELISSIYSKASLDEIAKKLYMSRTNLIRLFKKNTGITPYKFILDEKIKVAKALLSTTNMSVKSISEKLSFSDEHYFSHLFKEKVGISPLKYKSQKLIRGSDGE